MVADFVAENLFTDDMSRLRDALSDVQPETVNKFKQWILDLLKKLKNAFRSQAKVYASIEGIESEFVKVCKSAQRIWEQKHKPTAEQQKTSTESGGQYSIVEKVIDNNGKTYDNAVLLDTNFFNGISPRNWGKKLKLFVENRSKTKPFIMPVIDESGNVQQLQFAKTNDRVTKDNNSNHKVLDKLSNTSDNISKLSVLHIDEIITISEESNPYYTNENSHQWLDKNGWLHRNANVINSKNGNIYNLTLDIAKTNDGRIILYATDGKIKKVGNVQVNSLNKRGSGQNSNFKFSIPTSAEKVKTKLEDRVSGDDLLNAQDLIEEIESVGGAVDENGYVTVYHRTTENAKEKILSTGKMSAKEDGVFFSTKRDGQIEGYGNAVVEMKIPVERLVLDDIFDDEAHLRYPLKNRNATLDVSDYIVEPESKQYSLTQSDRKFADYDKPITLDDIKTLRDIGRKSINDFSTDEVEIAQKWAHKFYQQLGTKSPFFRRWFGDWRAYDKSKVNIVQKSMSKPFKAGKIKNLDTNSVISWGDQVKGETKIKYGVDSDVYSYLENIEQIVENAILLDTVVSVDSSKHKMPNTEFMHSFYAIVNDSSGSQVVVKLLVEEAYNNKMTEDFSRAYELQEIKKVVTLHTGVHSNEGGLTRQVTTNYNISDLFDFVKQNDKNFNPKFVNEALINKADGTPKVFYHGTNAKFTEFDKRKSKPGFYGRGFYFTTEKSQANVYGNEMEVYLNIKQPLMPNGAKVTEAQIIKFLEAVAENEDYSIENYGTYDVKQIVNNITSRDAFDVIQDINATAIGDFGEALQLFNEVNGTEFDGIITPTETVVYNANQIKSAKYGGNIGTFSEAENDIQYSLPQEVEEEYMSAVESGQEPEMQRLVDIAAKMAMPDSVVRIRI